MGMGTSCNCRCNAPYYNIEKLNKANGAVIWRKAIPAKEPYNEYAYNTDIQPLSDGGFVVNNNVLGLCRINSAGNVIVKQDTPYYRCPDDFPFPSRNPVLAVKQGSATPNTNGDPDISDKIFVAGLVIYCLDANLKKVWQYAAGYASQIKLFNNKLYVSGGQQPIRVLNPDDGSLQDVINLTQTNVFGVPEPAYFILQDVSELGFIGWGGFGGGQQGIMFFNKTGGEIVNGVNIGDTKYQLPMTWFKGRPLSKQINNFVLGNPDGTFGSNDNYITVAANNNGQKIYPTWLLGYSKEITTTTSNDWARNAITNQMTFLDSSSAIVVVGGAGWLPKSDSKMIYDPFRNTYDTFCEYKNVWAFEPDGSLRWTNAQTYETSYSGGNYSFRDLNNDHYQAVPYGLARYLKYGVAVGTQDGHPVVTSLSTPVRKKWTSTAVIKTQTYGHAH